MGYEKIIVYSRIVERVELERDLKEEMEWEETEKKTGCLKKKKKKRQRRKIR